MLCCQETGKECYYGFSGVCDEITNAAIFCNNEDIVEWSSSDYYCYTGYWKDESGKCVKVLDDLIVVEKLCDASLSSCNEDNICIVIMENGINAFIDLVGVKGLNIY